MVESDLVLNGLNFECIPNFGHFLVWILDIEQILDRNWNGFGHMINWTNRISDTREVQYSDETQFRMSDIQIHTVIETETKQLILVPTHHQGH